jgi:hypothetical protein
VSQHLTPGVILRLNIDETLDMHAATQVLNKECYIDVQLPLRDAATNAWEEATQSMPSANPHS